jgi:hypothetical protein
MTWDKLGSFLVLAFVSFQGVLLLVVPEYRNRLYATVAQGTSSATQSATSPFLSSNPSLSTAGCS